MTLVPAARFGETRLARLILAAGGATELLHGLDRVSRTPAARLVVGARAGSGPHPGTCGIHQGLPAQPPDGTAGRRLTHCGFPTQAQSGRLAVGDFRRATSMKNPPSSGEAISIAALSCLTRRDEVVILKWVIRLSEES